MKYRYLAVDRIPKQLESEVVYHSEEFELGALLCACGCGHKVMLLVPDGHQVISENGSATVMPSISVLDAPCKSHYFITRGRVERLPAFSAAQAAAIMRRQIERHMRNDTKKRTWAGWIRAAVAKTAGRLRSFFGF
jgi:hypothetical protein